MDWKSAFDAIAHPDFSQFLLAEVSAPFSIEDDPFMEGSVHAVIVTALLIQSAVGLARLQSSGCAESSCIWSIPSDAERPGGDVSIWANTRSLDVAASRSSNGTLEPYCNVVWSRRRAILRLTYA